MSFSCRFTYDEFHRRTISDIYIRKKLGKSATDHAIAAKRAQIISYRARKAERESTSYICRNCGITYRKKQPKPGQGEKYCSRACCFADPKWRRPRQLKTCKGCHVAFTAIVNRHSVYCSDECRKASKRPRKQRIYIRNPRVLLCDKCIRPFTRSNSLSSGEQVCKKCLQKRLPSYAAWKRKRRLRERSLLTDGYIRDRLAKSMGYRYSSNIFPYSMVLAERARLLLVRELRRIKGQK